VTSHDTFDGVEHERVCANDYLTPRVFVCVLGLFSCVSIFYAPIKLITQPERHRVDGC
jgi:hypothetical protein